MIRQSTFQEPYNGDDQYHQCMHYFVLCKITGFILNLKKLILHIAHKIEFLCLENNSIKMIFSLHEIYEKIVGDSLNKTG